jgi:hypothetical protein
LGCCTSRAGRICYFLRRIAIPIEAAFFNNSPAIGELFPYGYFFYRIKKNLYVINFHKKSKIRVLIAPILQLALNSDKFCGAVLYRNLRFTNWRRQQGCRCSALKPTVDWCGCSPLALRTEEANAKLELEK